MRRLDGPSWATLSFLGGVGTVTGSKFLIETPDARVLVDCGLFQGLKQDRRRNWDALPIAPDAIDAVVVTHAHIDHVGYLPRLVRCGFDGAVTCTAGTASLAAIVLPDSGHLQEEDAEWANRRGYSKHHPALPLYTEADAWRALEHLRPVPFSTATEVAPGVVVTLEPAGHILGSSTVRVELDGRSLLFSGDLGRPSHPLLVPPTPPSAVDAVVMESTYGGREHDTERGIDVLRDVVTRTAARGGTVVVPAFAVDRTEVVLHELRRLMLAGEIPDLPIYADSPMALRALQVYREAIADHAPDVRADVAVARRTDPRGPFDAGTLHEIHEVEDSKALAGRHGPMIIVSASGMATGGRVLHHLARLLPDHRNSVVLAGFQAAGTRGRSLVEGATAVKMLGSYVPVRAEIASIRSFSVHAGHDELLGWLGSGEHLPSLVYLVHGEELASAALRDSIESRFGIPAAAPSYLERVAV